ncbi:hypothetical protein SAMN05660242_1890 [Thermoanaerobacterium sp. RBIITD]|nr:hypothetical protein [Thermoanaerobacterium sp. RBIITD]SNX54240.1 hypothetical protein SAMN05660242_1890 [Thermoanaerobacterium sp. RBIITD]
MTEVAGVLALVRLSSNIEEWSCTVGPPVDNTEIKIINLQKYQDIFIGDIVCRSPSIADYYLDEKGV